MKLRAEGWGVERRIRRNTFLVGLLSVMLLLSLGRIAHADRMRRFDASISLVRSGLLDVTETLVVDFGKAQRHGIYRIIPVAKSSPVTIAVIGITEGAGKPCHYTQTRSSTSLQLRIGDAQKLITGQHTYHIHYTVNGAVRMFNGKPQVYLNVTGNGWQYPIDAATARFFPPRGVKASQLRTQAFAGPLGSRSPAKTQVSAQSVLFSTGNVPVGSGLTFWVILPVTAVAKPAARPTPKPRPLSAALPAMTLSRFSYERVTLSF